MASDSWNAGGRGTPGGGGKAARNDHTGDLIKTKVPNAKYRDNYDRIFAPKSPPAALPAFAEVEDV